MYVKKFNSQIEYKKGDKSCTCYIRIITILLSFFILNIYALSAQEKDSKNILIEDFREFVSVLESTHPDPYYPFGGKMPFHNEVQKIINTLSDPTFSKVDFQDILSRFTSKLHDGHTFIITDKQQKNSTDKVLNLKFKIVADGLIVSRSERRTYNGLKITSINGISIEDLLEKAQFIKPCENRAGSYLSVAQLLDVKSSSEKLLGQIDNDMIRICFTDIKNQTHVCDIDYVDPANRNILSNTGSASRATPSIAAPFGYQFIDNNNKVVCFTYHSTYSREVIELQKKWGLDYTQNLKMLYETYKLGDIPVDYTEAIQKLPSINETFFEMLQSMKKSNSTHLVIDLRENGGGWNPINIPSLYMLKGDEYFKGFYKAQYNTLISDLFLQTTGTDIDEYNNRNNSDFQIGDYNFGFFMGKPWPENMPLKERRNRFLENNYGNTISGIQLLKNMDGQAVYNPHIIVITSPKTFSAAFQYSYLLKDICNATIVGVPSSQAPNNGMGTTFYTLKNTNIKLSISNSYQLFDPKNNLKDAMLIPDYPLSWDIFMKYNCNEESEILYITDLISKGKLN